MVFFHVQKISVCLWGIHHPLIPLWIQWRRNYGDRGYIGHCTPQVQDLYPLYPPSQRRDLCQNFKQTTLTTRLYKVRTNLYPAPRTYENVPTCLSGSATVYSTFTSSHLTSVQFQELNALTQRAIDVATATITLITAQDDLKIPVAILLPQHSDTTIWTASAGLFYDQHRVARFLTSHDEILETCLLVHLMPDKCIYMIPQAYILATSYKLHKLTSGRQENGAKIQDLPGNPGTTGCCQLQYPKRFSLFLGVGVIQAKSGSSPTLRGVRKPLSRFCWLAVTLRLVVSITRNTTTAMPWVHTRLQRRPPHTHRLQQVKTRLFFIGRLAGLSML